MSRRSSSRSGSGSETGESSGRSRSSSEASHDDTVSESQARAPTATNTIDGTSLADTATQRSASPTASHTSGTTATGSRYDTASIATSTQTGITSSTVAGQQSQVSGSVPIIRPPVLSQQTSSSSGTVGPQRPTGYQTQSTSITSNTAAQAPIRIDVAAAQQQYQQRGAQPEISPYSSGSTASSTSGSLSSPGTASLQQNPRYNAAATAVTRQGEINQANVQQQQQQQQQQQAQFANQIPAHLVYNELLGPDAFKDVILDIDYGALGGFNVAFQSGGDFSGGQLPPGINIRPAYTTVDSLNYQQHMFNTARTIYPGSEGNQYDYSGANNSYNYEGANSSYNVSGGQQFDLTKAIFNQVDSNRDGTISQDEFRHWAQGGQQSYGSEQTYSASAVNYQNAPSSAYQAGMFDGANADVAKILQQSGLGQVVPNQ